MRWVLSILISIKAFGVETPKSNEEMWKVLNTYHAKVDPGLEIPQYPQYYYWETTGTNGSFEAYKKKIPVYIYDEPSSLLIPAGWINIGVQVALNHFLTESSVIYYRVDPKLVEFTLPDVNSDVWLNGRYIKKVPEKSFRPPQGWSSKHGLRVRPKAKK